MSDRPKRRFTVLDMMILVAALAGGILLARLVWEERAAHYIAFSTTDYPWSIPFLGISIRHPLEIPVLVISVMTPMAAMINLTLVPLRLLPPRPRRRDLCKSAGWLFGMISSLALVVGATAIFIPLYVGHAVETKEEFAVFVLMLLPMMLASAVMAVWLLLRLLGRRVQCSDWVDSVTWGITLFWVISMPCCLSYLTNW